MHAVGQCGLLSHVSPILQTSSSLLGPSMANPARAQHLQRNAGEQNLKMADLRDCAQAFPIDAIWVELWRHVSNHAWARIAGTCKASWKLQLQSLHLTSNSPVAGKLRHTGTVALSFSQMLQLFMKVYWHLYCVATGMTLAELLRAGYPFLLNRCQDASFISLTHVADPARKALRARFGYNSKLEHLRKLEITDSPNGKEYIAPYLCSKCPSLQVRQRSHNGIITRVPCEQANASLCVCPA